PHVQPPGRIREHLQDVVRRPRGVGARGERAALVPALLPACLHRLGVVSARPFRAAGHSGRSVFSLSLAPTEVAMASSTPFTKAAESSLPKRRAISIASSIVTDAGMSG